MNILDKVELINFTSVKSDIEMRWSTYNPQGRTPRTSCSYHYVYNTQFFKILNLAKPKGIYILKFVLGSNFLPMGTNSRYHQTIKLRHLINLTSAWLRVRNSCLAHRIGYMHILLLCIGFTKIQVMACKLHMNQFWKLSHRWYATPTCRWRICHIFDPQKWS